MDSAVFMERYGYKALLVLSILMVVAIAAAVSTTILNLLKEFGGYMALLIILGIVIYVLLSRGRGKNERAEVERQTYERGLKRY